MKFELTAELVSQIVFGMENQETTMVFDTHELAVTEARGGMTDDDMDDSPDGRYLPLPEWKSVDGFNLMESFVANLRNPIVREELRQILRNGRGVFRQYKNALKERPDIERLWFHHRQKEMNQRVLEWYNDYRELWGLEPYAVIEQDSGKDDLVFSDFEFRDARPDESPHLAAWDRRLFDEMFPDALDCDREYYWLIWRSHLPKPAAGEGSRVLLAATPDGEIAGFIWVIESEVTGVQGSRLYGRVLQLAILPEFRGIGIGSTLLRYYRHQAGQRGMRRLLVDLPESVSFLSKTLKSLGFSHRGVVWESGLED
jgi:GNAT superfamily N-acetyltransferase